MNKRLFERVKSFFKVKKKEKSGISFAAVYLITLSISRRFSPINLSLIKPVWSCDISLGSILFIWLAIALVAIL